MNTQVDAMHAACRPYQDQTIDELFYELTASAREAKGLIDFAHSLYGADTNAKIEAPAVLAFLQAISQPIHLCEDALNPVLYELREREKEWRHGQAKLPAATCASATRR